MFEFLFESDWITEYHAELLKERRGKDRVYTKIMREIEDYLEKGNVPFDSDMRRYIEAKDAQIWCEREITYKQGYLDCIALLRELGFFSPQAQKTFGDWE